MRATLFVLSILFYTNTNATTLYPTSKVNSAVFTYTVPPGTGSTRDWGSFKYFLKVGTSLAGASTDTTVCVIGDDSIFRYIPFSVLINRLNSGFMPLSDSNNYARNVGWITPQMFGAYGDGIHDDTYPVRLCQLLGINTWWYGAYLVSDSIKLRSDQVLYSNNAILVMATTSKSYLVADNIDNWRIDGKLTIQGSASHSAGTATALKITGGHFYSFNNILFKSISGYGFHILAGGSTIGEGSMNNNLSFTDCYTPFQIDAGRGGEYNQLSNINVHACSNGGKILAGNINMVNGNITENDSGLYVGGSYGTNNSHGAITNFKIAHNTAYQLLCDSIQYGETFTSCDFYGNPGGTNGIEINGSVGVNFNGGIIDGRINIQDNYSNVYLNNIQLESTAALSGYPSRAVLNQSFVRTGTSTKYFSGNTGVSYDPSGTFVPSLSPVSGSITLGTASGKYVRTGNEVKFTLYCSVTGISSPSGTLTLLGLPFAAGNTDANYTAVTIYANALNTSAGVVENIIGYIGKNASTITIFKFKDGGTDALSNDVMVGTEFMISGHYFVD